MDYNLQEKIMELKGEEGDLQAVTPDDFDRAAQIIRETRKMIGAGLNSAVETEQEVSEENIAENAENIEKTDKENADAAKKKSRGNGRKHGTKGDKKDGEDGE